MGIPAEKIREKANAIRRQIAADRRALHQIPEIGTDLPQTSAYIKKRLDEMQIQWKDCGEAETPILHNGCRRYMDLGYVLPYILPQNNP